MKILMIGAEFPPYGSDIANVAYVIRVIYQESYFTNLL